MRELTELERTVLEGYLDDILFHIEEAETKLSRVCDEDDLVDVKKSLFKAVELIDYDSPEARIKRAAEYLEGKR